MLVRTLALLFVLVWASPALAAAPVFESAASDVSDGSSTDHIQDMPASIASTNGILILAAIRDSLNTIATPSGYTAIFSIVQSAGDTRVRCQAFWKISAGSEPSTITLQTSGGIAAPLASRIFRISNVHQTNLPVYGEAHVNETTAVLADPPSFSPVAGSKEYLWVAAGCLNATAAATVTPTGYGNLNSIATATITARILSGTKTATAASEDPGPWQQSSAASKRWSAVTIAIEPSAAVPDFPITSVLDDFNRANEGPPPSASWINIRGNGLKVVSNQVQRDTTTALHGSAWDTVLSGDQEVFATMAWTPSVAGGSWIFGLIFRWQDANNYYLAVAVTSESVNNRIDIYQVVGGTETLVGSAVIGSATFASGQTFGVSTDTGGNFEVWKNGALIDTVVDSSPVFTTSGRIGLFIYDNAETRAMDDFGGGGHSVFTPAATSGGLLLRGVN